MKDALLKSALQTRQRHARYRKYDSVKACLFLVVVCLSLWRTNHHRTDTTTTTLDVQDGNGAITAETEATRQLRKKQEDVSNFSNHSCNDIYHYTVRPNSNVNNNNYHTQRQCAFATTCNGGNGIFLGEWIYCQKSEDAFLSSRAILWLVCPPLALLLVLLFRILGSTAEEFFSPGLELLSVKLGLPERFAGVTLLALGNGAPDIASTVNAITNDRQNGYLLALGELTGTSMVASTIVCGAVAFVSPTLVPCRGALVRDVVMFMITMTLVFFAFHDGTLDPHEIKLFLGLYLAYVLVVLAADLYHRNCLILPPVTSTRNDDETPNENTCLTGASNNPTPPAATHSPSPLYIKRIVSVFTNYDDDTSGDEPHEGDPPMLPLPSHATKLSTSSSGWGAMDGTTDDEPLLVFHPHHGGIVDLKHPLHAQSVAPSPPHTHQSWWHVRDELVEYSSNFWQSMYGPNSGYNAFDKVLMTCELPFTIFRLLSIPVPCDGYYCRPLVALSVIFSPIWMCYYFYDQFEICIWRQHVLVIAIVFAVPLMIGLIVLGWAPRGDIPPRPSAAALLTLIGFVVSATWLDFIGDKLVTLMTFFGIVCQIPSTIMGLTILAWGNCSQDLIANVKVAKKDLSTMAITASFAGPVFNILIGLGLSFAILDSGTPIPVHLDNPLRVGFLFSVLNGAFIIVSGICFGKGFIPKKYGYVAMSIYLVYVAVSLTI